MIQIKKMRSKLTSLLLATLLIFQMFLPVQMFFNPPRVEIQEAEAAGSDWLSGWDYRTPIEIDGNTEDLTNYQVQITLQGTDSSAANYVDFDKVLADGADIRFTDDDKTTEIDFWIEEWIDTSGSESATVWLEIPSILTAGTKTIYVYYGKSDANSAGNFDNTFTKDYEESGLVGLWHFDDSTSPTADSSGNGNNGTVHNATWADSDGGQWNGRSDVIFATGDSLDFDGDDDYVNCGNDPSLDITDAITIEAWVKFNSHSVIDTIISHEQQGSYWLYYYPAGNQFWFEIAGSSGRIGVDKEVDLARWYHIIATFDSGSYSFFIDGVSYDFSTQGSATEIGHSVDDHQNVLIGRYMELDNPSLIYPFNGAIDEVRIYNRALNQNEIQSHYERRRYTATEPTAITTSSFRGYDKIFSGITNIVSATDYVSYSAEPSVSNLVDFIASPLSGSVDVVVTDTLIDLDYQNSALVGLSVTNIDRETNLNNNGASSMIIVPASGSIDASIDTWNTSGTYYKKWTETGSGDIDTAHTVGDLRTGQYYQVKVDSSIIETLQADGSGQISFTYSGGYSDKEFEIEEIPLAPTIGAPAVLSSSSIQWNFTDNADNETGFRIYDNTDTLAVSSATADLTYLNETGLSENTLYTGRYATAYNDYGNSASSSAASSVYTLADTPTNLATSAQSANQIDISVDAFPNHSTGSSGYYFNNTTATANSGWQAGDNTWSETDLSVNTQYTYQAKYRNGDETETSAIEASKYTLIQTPAAISFDDVGVNSFTISATGTISNLTSGSSGLYFDETSGEDNGADSTWLQTNSYQNTGLSENTQYSYRVKARNGDSAETSYTDTLSKYTLADTPTNLVGEAGIMTMDLSVDSLPNHTNDLSGYYFENITKGTNSGWIQTNFWQNTGLTCNTLYAYTVKYRNGDGVETETIPLTKSTDSCGGGSTPAGSQNPPELPTPNPENPKGEFKILINNGDEVTNNRTANLKLFAGLDTTKMIVSENPDFKNSIQELYQETRQWSLSYGDGLKTVYVKFYTKYGIESEIVSDGIILDTGLKKEITLIKPETPVENKPVLPNKKTSLPKTSIKESIALNPIVITKNLKFGSNNNQVANLQDKLKQLNLFPKEIKSNGNFGPSTKQAVKEFQKSVGIYPCGIIGPRTRKALNNQEFITNKDYQFTQDLKYNDKGEEVKQLQTRLRDQSFFPHYVKSTGWFGPITQKAVKLFQKFYGIIQNGIVDELVRKRLNF